MKDNAEDEAAQPRGEPAGAGDCINLANYSTRQCQSDLASDLGL